MKKLRIAIVTNLNGIGLSRDYEVLSNFLLELGHKSSVFQWDVPLDDKTMKFWRDEVGFDLLIFLEVTPREFMPLAPVRWLFANHEWVKPEQIKVIDKYIDRIFTKTQEGQRVLEPIFPERTVFTGFLARDQYMPEIERKPWFLHIGGNSTMRGTQAVVDAWKWEWNGNTLERHLIVVSTALKERPEIPMVTYYHERIDEEELRSLQNECMFHIYPSGTEGFGQALHEALSVGATVFTTDAPPMNELGAVYPLSAKKVSKYNLADIYEVDATTIFSAAYNASEIYKRRPAAEWQAEREFNRSVFLTGNEMFKKIFNDQLNFHMKPAMAKQLSIKKRQQGFARIVFLGNFEAAESTENMVKWALESLGHEVVPIQENRATMDWLTDEMEFSDIFLWVHTRNYLPISDANMHKFLESCGKPTISLHLDKFWGLPEREAEIGHAAFWKTRFVFTADGSEQQRFADRGVNHFWMKPAVSEVYCHRGVLRERFMCDVGFVGARGYHSEYPFRPKLLEFLETTYGNRFKHIEGVRGHELNDFYASCKVVVGDCIFAGTPRYWSDRVPETCGRGGFLLHPQVEELDINLATYVPQSTESLREHIEWWLGHDIERERLRLSAAAYVRSSHTWEVRMKEILQVVGQADAHMKVLGEDARR